MAEVAGDRSGRRPLFPPEMQETGDIGAHLVGHGVEPGDVEGLWAVNVHASDAAAGVDDTGKHPAGNLAPAVGFGHRPCRAPHPLAQRDRSSVRWGTSVSVLVDHGGLRNIKKKTKIKE